jgi:YegS/Rv2252/BmrU family lipid kinase
MRDHPPRALPERAAVIFNPVSGHIPAAQRTRVIQDAFAAAGVAVDWFETTVEDAGGEVTAKAVRNGADLIAVSGGDGTVRACATGLAGSGVPMAILPSGTGNLLAVNLGVPRALKAAVEVALTGQRRAIDVGMGDVHVAGVPSFLVMGGLGFDAAMLLNTKKKLKRRVGNLAYVRSGLVELRYPQDEYTIAVDDDPPVTLRASCVLVANVGRIGRDITVVHGALPDDGLLDVAVIRARSVGDWIQVAAQVTFRRRWGDVRVATFRARRVRITSKGLHHLEYDGEVHHDPVNRLTVEAAPGAVTVCVP